MQYTTIILELIRQNEPLHDQLRRERTLLATVERTALELKASHEALTEQLGRSDPAGDPLTNSSLAFETALKEMEERLLPASHPTEDETLSLDAAMAFPRRSPTG